VIRHLSYVMCDRCGNQAVPYDDAKEARRYAIAEGYVRLKGYVRLDGRRIAEDVCRQCAEEAGLR
jgi:hypothetical protein